MIGAVVIRDLRGRTKATRKPTFVRPYASGMAHLKLQFTKHERRGTFTVSAIYPANDFALVRATGVIGTYLKLESNQTARLPAIPFISVRLPRADAGGLRGCPSTAFRRRLNLSRPFRLPGSLIRTYLSIAIQSLQKSFRGFAQAFHFILSAGKSGLVGRLDGHQPTIRKLVNVRFSHGEIQHEQR